MENEVTPPQGVREVLDDLSPTHRRWVLPVLRAIADLGGKAKPMHVEKRIRETVCAHLNDLQWAYIRNGNYIRWARFGMKERGLVGGERGTWELTEAGRQLLDELADEPGEIPDSIPELAKEKAGNVSAELTTLPATSYDGYHVPILAILAERGLTSKSDLVAELGRRVAADLLDADRGTLPAGHVLWRYRVSWALTMMKKAGELKNPILGSWDITPSGRARLEAEQSTWSLKAFQTSKAKVRPPGSIEPIAADEAMEPIADESAKWTIERWRKARAKLGDEIHRALDLRLRPDLGPTPDFD